jgi:pyruvate,water dikinase
MEEFGHRGPNEFELSCPHPAEDPAWFDRELDIHREFPVDVDAMLENQRKDFANAWQGLRTGYPKKANSIKRRIDENGRRARLREQARSEYVRDRWVMRLFAVRAGELSGLGDDIFFLTLDEVLELLAGKKIAIEYIPHRKKDYLLYKLLPVCPSLIKGQFDPIKWANGLYRDEFYHNEFYNDSGSAVFGDHSSNTITGSPGSAGRVEGIVRCIRNPEEGVLLHPGEILVAVHTDISWTLHFPRAAAVVTDVGAPLSHAAIVAREFGIPAVVGCGNATQRLATGDRVRVDGARGIVEVIEKKE